MNIFLETDYRKIIKESVVEQKQKHQKFSFSTLAHEMNMQKSYLSKVLSGGANLTNDQAYLFCQFCQFNQDEENYFNLLVESKRTAIKKRSDIIQKKIQKVRQDKIRTEDNLKSLNILNKGDFEKYYSNPYHLFVLISLSIDEYNFYPHKICEKLRIPDHFLNQILKNLEQEGLIKFDKGGYTKIAHNIHMSRANPQFLGWKSQFNAFTQEKINTAKEEDSYTFNLCFSADDESFDKIRKEFLEFLNRCEDIVKMAPAKKLFNLSFDFLKV